MLLYRYCFVLLCVWGQFPSLQVQYIRREGGGGLCYEFGGLIHGGAYFQNFTVLQCLDFYSTTVLVRSRTRLSYYIIFENLYLCGFRIVIFLSYCRHIGKLEDPGDQFVILIYHIWKMAVLTTEFFVTGCLLVKATEKLNCTGWLFTMATKAFRVLVSFTAILVLSQNTPSQSFMWGGALLDIQKMATSCDIIITGSKCWFLFLFCLISLLDILLQHPLKVKVSVRMFSIIDFLNNYTYSHLIVNHTRWCACLHLACI